MASPFGLNTMRLRSAMKAPNPRGILPNAQVLAVPAANPTAIDISVVSFGGQSTADSGLVGSVRFRTTDAFSSTTLRCW